MYHPRLPYIPDTLPACALPQVQPDRGISGLKSIITAIAGDEGTVRLPEHTPLVCIPYGKDFRTVKLSTIRNIYIALKVTVDGEAGEKLVLDLPDRETRLLEEFLLNEFKPSAKDVELAFLNHINASFTAEHGELDRTDFDKIFSIQEAMFEARINQKSPSPLPGDTVSGTYYNGKHVFRSGLIVQTPPWTQETDPPHVHYCAGPYVPFVFLHGGNEPGMDCSGGPWFKTTRENLQYAGKEERLFKVFGHSGATGNGAVRFPCTVNRWTMIMDDTLSTRQPH